MARLINASICLTDIDKERIIVGKNKKKYLPIKITVNDEANRYDQDVSIQHQIEAEERKAGVKATYLGNGKTVWHKKPETATAPNNEDVPF